MERRHDEALMARMDEVTCRGWSYVYWWEAYLWYDQKKLGKNFWRDLKSRFDDNKENKSAVLNVYSTDEGVLLINSDGLEPISKMIGDADSD